MAMLKFDIRRRLSDPPREVEIDEKVYETVKLRLTGMTMRSGNLLRTIAKLKRDLVSDHGIHEDAVYTIVYSAWKVTRRGERGAD